jgi:hypothetical protein
MADSYLLDLMKRVVAMQLEAITPLAPDVGVDAVYKWPYQQNRFPYFTNRLGSMPVSGGGIDPGQYATDIDLYSHQVLMRLVVAHLTQGIDTDVPNNVYDYIVQVEDYFRTHPQMATDSGTYSTCPDWILEDSRISGHTGIAVFTQGGVGQAQIGCEFTLLIPILREVY